MYVAPADVPKVTALVGPPSGTYCLPPDCLISAPLLPVAEAGAMLCASTTCTLLRSHSCVLPASELHTIAVFGDKVSADGDVSAFLYHRGREMGVLFRKHGVRRHMPPML